MVLFNPGYNPEILPTFKVGNKKLEYKETVKFLGIFLTAKLTWNTHIENIITKARKKLKLYENYITATLGPRYKITNCPNNCTNSVKINIWTGNIFQCSKLFTKEITKH